MEQGYLRDEYSADDLLYRGVAPLAARQIPSAFEISFGDVPDQGQLPTCVPHAMAGMLYVHENRRTGAEPTFDVAEFYGRCRVAEGQPVSGCRTRTAANLLVSEGMLFEGQRFRASMVARLTDAMEIRQAVFTQGPVVLGTRFSSADLANLPENSVVPYSDRLDLLHAMLVVGYDDQAGLLRLRNTWGPNWGDRGHCWLPYDYLERLDPSFDAWTVVSA